MNPVPTWGAILKPDLALSMTLNLQFAIDRAYVARRGPLPTFTNATTTARTYVGSNGLLTTAAINVPRIEFDPITGQCLGLLIEEQRQNLVPRSEELSDASWFKYIGTVTANAGVAPDGNITADLVYPNSSGNVTGQLYRVVTGITAGDLVTVSFFAKSAGKSICYLARITNSSVPDAYFNLSTGAITNVTSGMSAQIKQYPNGWWRVSLTSTASAGTQFAWIGSVDSAGSQFNTASGTNGILVWGAQVEVGAFASSYIPTTTTSLVRSADVCSITGAAFTGFYNQTEGAMVFKGSRIGLQPSPVPGYIQIDDGTATERILLYNSGVSEDYLVTDNGLTSANLSTGATVPNNTLFGMAARYKVNDFAVSRSGASPVTTASGSVPTTTAFRIGNRNTSGFHNGHIYSIQYFNAIKTNAQLQALSTP